MLELFPAFNQIPDKDAAEAWLTAHGRIQTLKGGEVLMHEGEPVDYMTFVLSGALELMLMRQSDRRLHLQGVLEAGEITGVLPYSRLKKATGQATARVDTTLYRLHRDQFPALITEQPAVTEALVHLLSNRIRDFTRQDVQSEKLSALGRMAAGLAHELNNPAAALRSLALDLNRRLEALTATLSKPGEASTTDEGESTTNLFSEPGPALTGLAKARAIRDLEDWLEGDLAIEQASALAGDLADMGYTYALLYPAMHGLSRQDAAHMITTETQALGLRQLAVDIGEAASRISALVESVKDFSHMDQAHELEPVNLTKSVTTALRLLAHKAREHQVVVDQQLPADLPQALGHPGELSQVWTNILDNAFYAAAQTATQPARVTLRGSCTAEMVWVEFEDNGPGIPSEAMSRIFEPFYTTKKVGEGTGLGLELARRIIDQAGGDIQIESEPGCTVFKVLLPRAPVS